MPTEPHKAEEIAVEQFVAEAVIENSHRPTRKREKIMGRFKPSRQAQRFLSAHDQIAAIFRPRRYKLPAPSYRYAREDAFGLPEDSTGEMNA